MITSLAAGDTIRIGDSVLLTVLAIDNDLVKLGIESPESDENPSVVLEPNDEAEN
jgi:sRNA-binding carbon storage regulator CsrA